MKRKLRRWMSSFRSALARARWYARDVGYRFGRFLGWLLRQVRAFRQRKSLRYLLLGLPALLVGIATAALGFMIWVDPPDQRVLLYRGAGDLALRENNLGTAEVIYERLAMMDESQPEYRYRLALTMQAMAGKEAEAARTEASQSHQEQARAHEEQANTLFNRSRAMMNTLAIPSKQGYGPAHVWWARLLMSQPTSPDSLQVAERHLRFALQINSEDVRANELIGQLFLGMGQLKEAETHLKKAVGTMPGLDLTLAELYRRQGAKDLARLHAEKAQRFFRQQTQADMDNHQARLGWAQATLFLEDFPTAVGILQEGSRLSGSPAYKTSLARAYVAWSDALARNPQAPIGERLTLLEKAIQYDFSNLTALVRLANIAKAKDEASAEKARAALRALLAEGKSPAVVHLLLGMEAQARDKVEDARLHYEQAYKLSPQTPVVVNNLAWALAHSDKPDLKEALNLINTVLQRMPNQLRFRETRGQILAKMGNYDEALPDLEAALRVLSGQPALHKTLAEIYRKRGDLATAAEHERRAGPPAEAPAVPGEAKPDEGKVPNPKTPTDAPKQTDK